LITGKQFSLNGFLLLTVLLAHTNLQALLIWMLISTSKQRRLSGHINMHTYAQHAHNVLGVLNASNPTCVHAWTNWANQARHMVDVKTGFQSIALQNG